MTPSLMSLAWRRYHQIRLGVWYSGDEVSRRFIRSIFAKALRAAWVELKASRAQAEHLRAIAADVAPVQSEPITPARARAIEAEIERLKYAPFSVNQAERESALRAELNTETEHQRAA